MASDQGEVVIRPAVQDDLSDIAAIYNHEIANSTATFDLEPPTYAYWEQRLAGKHEGDHPLVALPNPGSIALHKNCGFEHVGTMREVGWKFDQWVDVEWYQKLLVPDAAPLS